MSVQATVRARIQWTPLGRAALHLSSWVPGFGSLAAWAVGRWSWAFYSVDFEGAR